MGKMRIGIVGCGDISDIYLENFSNLYREVEVTWVCDVIEDRAKAAAEKYSIFHYTVEMNQLMESPDVDIVLNLGRTYDHYLITEAALQHGKHVYSEKPLGITLEEGKNCWNWPKKKDFVSAAHRIPF